MIWPQFSERLYATDEEVCNAMQYGERFVYEDCIDDKVYRCVAYWWDGKLYFTQIEEVK